MQERYRKWPALPSLFVFSKSGVKTERDRLVVDFDRPSLSDKRRRFYALPGTRKAAEFHEGGGRTVKKIRRQGFVEGLIRPISYRFLDRRYLYNDPDFVSRYGPETQTVWGGANVGLYALPSRTGYGPAAVAVGELPDYHAFRGSYGGYVFPLYNRMLGGAMQLSKDEAHSNISPHLGDALRALLSSSLEDREIFCFIYAVLFCDQYSLLFSSELQREFARVPFPKSLALFEMGARLGNRLVDLHTSRIARPPDALARLHGQAGLIGKPSFTDGHLWVSEKAEVAPVSEGAWEFAVSGYPVLRRWIEHREGRALDLDTTRELLQVIFVLEATLELAPRLTEFADQILSGEVYSAKELRLEK